MADLKRHRSGRPSERHEPGKYLEAVPHRKPKKKQGKREDNLEGLPVVVIEHSLTRDELATLFGEEGFNYSLNQERYLKVFLDDGKVPMNNNAAEQSIRGFCIGKKNWVMIDTVSRCQVQCGHLQHCRNCKIKWSETV